MFQFGLFSTHLPYLLIAGIYFFGMISISFGSSPVNESKSENETAYVSITNQEYPLIVLQHETSASSQAQSCMAIQAKETHVNIYIFSTRAIHAEPQCPGILPGYLTRLNGRAPPLVSC
jgi:hypothetical protein